MTSYYVCPSTLIMAYWSHVSPFFIIGITYPLGNFNNQLDTLGDKESHRRQAEDGSGSSIECDMHTN